MEVNKHINFLKRRGFLIKESSELPLHIQEGLNFDMMCHSGYEVFCELSRLAKENGIKENPKLAKELVDSITKLWKYLKPPKRESYKKTSKFSKLISTILRQNWDSAVNTIKIITKEIESVDSTELRKVINTTPIEEFDNEEELEKLINSVKYKSYTEYENSFLGDHFVEATGARKLELSYKGEVVENQNLTNVIHHFFVEGKDYRVLSKTLYNNIINNFKGNVGKYIKADLKCIKPLYDENGKQIIGKDDYVEVKKMDYNLDSYLSEFFAIYKSPKSLPDVLKTVEGVEYYNKIVDGLYSLIRQDDGGILKYISENFAGIIYEENRFISKKDIRLYWSNKGQRSTDHRLSIRFRVVSNDVDTYIYDKNNDILRTETISDVDITRKDKDLEILESINEATVTDKGGRDWDRYSPQGKMIRTKGGTKELDDEFDWARQHLDEIPDDPKIYALIKHLGLNNVIGPDFVEDYGDWYGHHTIIRTNNGQEWVVGDDTSMGNALYEYWDTYIYDHGYGDLDIDLTDYIDVSDYWIETFCDEEVEYRIGDLSDEEFLEEYSYYDVVADVYELRQEEKETQQEYDDILEDFKYYKEAFETMEIQNQDYLSYGYEEPQHTEEEFEFISNKLEELESELVRLEKRLEDIPYQIDDIIETLRRDAIEEYKDECLDCMSRPVYCLVHEKGLYGSENEAIEAMGFDIDRDALVDDYVINSNYSDMTGYNGVEEEVNGHTYILIRVS